MTGSQALIDRAGIGLLATLAGMIVCARFPYTIPKTIFDNSFIGLLAVSRYGLFYLTFICLKLVPRGDIPAFYYPQAVLGKTGLLIYRDFGSSYAPLHPYLDATLLNLWNSPLILVLFAMTAELLSVVVLLRVVRHFLDDQTIRTACIFYLFSAISLQFVTIDGQDNTLIALALAVSIWLISIERIAAAGVVFAACLVLVKFLPLLFLPVFIAACPKPMRFVLGATVTSAVGYLPFVWLVHKQILDPYLSESALKTAGDLPYIVEALTGRFLPSIALAVALVLALLSVYLIVFRLARPAGLEKRIKLLLYGIAGTTIVFLLVSQKSWPPYLMLSLLPLYLVVGSGNRSSLPWRAIFLGGFGIVALTEHSVWATVFNQLSSSDLHLLLQSGDRKGILFLSLEALLAAAYVVWLGIIVKAFVQLKHDAAYV
jgi:hypothetical protein